MFGCCTVLRWTHSISCNGYVPQSKGRWYESNSCGSIWKPYDWWYSIGTTGCSGGIRICMYRRNGGCRRAFPDAPIWNRTPGSAGWKGIAGICRKDYAKQRSTKDTCISGKQTISRIWWCSAQTCCKWKMHFLRSVRKRMPGRCHSVG